MILPHVFCTIPGLVLPHQIVPCHAVAHRVTHGTDGVLSFRSWLKLAQKHGITSIVALHFVNRGTAYHSSLKEDSRGFLGGAGRRREDPRAGTSDRGRIGHMLLRCLQPIIDYYCATLANMFSRLNKSSTVSSSPGDHLLFCPLRLARSCHPPCLESKHVPSQLQLNASSYLPCIMPLLVCSASASNLTLELECVTQVHSSTERWVNPKPTIPSLANLTHRRSDMMVEFDV